MEARMERLNFVSQNVYAVRTELQFMAFEIKKRLTCTKVIQFIGILICIFIIGLIVKSVFLFYPAIANSLEIENGTFNISASTTEMQNAFSASDLLSSVITTGSTAIYVILTAFLFYTTNKNTEQTANAQKIAYLERRLEKFYLPMQIALKEFASNKETIEKLNGELKLKQRGNSESDVKSQMRNQLLPIVEIWWNFEDDYNDVKSYTHLASEEVMKSLFSFIDIFKDFPRRYDENYTNAKDGEHKPEYHVDSVINSDALKKYLENSERLFEYHSALKLDIDKDATYLKKKLSKLVNL